MSKSDNLNLMNFIADHIMKQKPDCPPFLWLCIDYKIRARAVREAQKQFELWVLHETIAREKRDHNISTEEKTWVIN